MTKRSNALTRFMRRQCLPYCHIALPSGREVMFNRSYRPIFERHGSGPATPITEHEWVSEWAPSRAATYAYTDGTPERSKIANAKALLKDWGIDTAGSTIELCKRIAELAHVRTEPASGWYDSKGHPIVLVSDETEEGAHA